MKTALTTIVILTATILSLVVPALAQQPRPNVLFIAVDDLRPELGCYEKEHIVSPNFDRLAGSGVAFERAYCMVPTCGASRASLMTGLRPTPKRFITFDANAEKEAPNVVTLNSHFKNHGYHTLSLGKVFHDLEDSAAGWSEPAWQTADIGQSYRLVESRMLANHPDNKLGPPYEAADLPDSEYPDAQIANRAIEDLQKLKNRDQPFFLAVGFMKPHLPFVAPKKYWDLYERDTIGLPSNYHPPKDAPQDAIHKWGELRRYANVPRKGPVPDAMARDLIHGYYACVSFVDAQLGRLLDELDRLELAENTIVILWGDHGWNLGEHTLWCKHSCFETSMHSPLIVRAPGVTGSGQRTKARTKALTEFIDIYPSLCELAALPLPDHLEGSSFVPQLKDPNLAGKSAAIGRFKTGDTIRTDQFRFTQYRNSKGEETLRMLYNHLSDPEEDVNIAAHGDQAKVVESLGKALHQGMGKMDMKEKTYK
jgi:arylsulfatase A-like enzyme